MEERETKQQEMIRKAKVISTGHHSIVTAISTGHHSIVTVISAGHHSIVTAISTGHHSIVNITTVVVVCV